MEGVIPGILLLASCLLRKSQSVGWFVSIRQNEGKQDYLERFMSYLTETDNEIETLYRYWNSKMHQGQEDTKILKTTTQMALKTILAPLPGSYGNNSGNHISPGKQNCVRFRVSTVLWIYWTAERQLFGNPLTRQYTPEWMDTLGRRVFTWRGGARWWGNFLITYLRPHTCCDSSLFLRLPHRGFISNPKHREVSGQLGNVPPPHTGTVSAEHGKIQK